MRQPVICCNNHVFCSNCIKVWLEKSSQCPTCRVAITPENPCREIIGNVNRPHNHILFFFNVSYRTLFVLGKMCVIKYLFLSLCVCVFMLTGATTDSESNESCSVKRRLRKTRGELLLREYEVFLLSDQWNGLTSSIFFPVLIFLISFRVEDPCDPQNSAYFPVKLVQKMYKSLLLANRVELLNHKTPNWISCDL